MGPTHESLADLVLKEGFKERLKRTAKVVADATFPRSDAAPKPRKPKKPLIQRLKRTATAAANAAFPAEDVDTLYGRIYLESSNTLSKILRTAEKWSDQGGIFGTGGSKSSKKSTSDGAKSSLLDIKRKPLKLPSAAKALKTVIRDRNKARDEREREQRNAQRGPDNSAVSGSDRRRRNQTSSR